MEFWGAYDMDYIWVLRAMGFTISEMQRAGYNARDLFDGGISLRELVLEFSPDDLRKNGFSTQEILREAVDSFNIHEWNFREWILILAGFATSEMQIILWELRHLGFSEKVLRAVGFTASWFFTAVGFSPDDLRESGFSTQEILRAAVACFNIHDWNIHEWTLILAGFATSEIETILWELIGQFPLHDLRKHGFEIADLCHTGFDSWELQCAGFHASQVRAAERASAIRRDNHEVIGRDTRNKHGVNRQKIIWRAQCNFNKRAARRLAQMDTSRKPHRTDKYIVELPSVRASQRHKRAWRLSRDKQT